MKAERSPAQQEATRKLVGRRKKRAAAKCDEYSIPPHYTVKLVRDVHSPPSEATCRTDMANQILTTIMGDLPHEEAHILMLDAQCRIIGTVKVGQGGAHNCALSPGDALRPAIAHNARAIIFSHNHPSGDTNPSFEDRALTNRLKRACDLLGIALADHIIVCDDVSKAYSMHQGGDL